MEGKVGEMKIDPGRKPEYTDTSIGAAIKPLVWVGSSKKDLKRLDKAILQQMGFELFAVQEGKAPSDFKPMPSIGSGVYELRVHVKGETRLVYVAKFHEAVYVLHVFAKRTQKTSKRDLLLATQRLAEVVTVRSRRNSS